MHLRDLSEATRARFKAIDESRSVREAADAFSDGKLGLVIVCDGAGLAIGVVSKSDLVQHLARAGGVDRPISDVMTRAIISGSPGDDLRGTWELMVRRRLQNLPLLGPNRRPVGTLDIRDALHTIIELEQAQEVQLINYIAGLGYR